MWMSRKGAPESEGGRSPSWSGEPASSPAASALGAGEDAQPKAARTARKPARRELGDVEKCIEAKSLGRLTMGPSFRRCYGLPGFAHEFGAARPFLTPVMRPLTMLC
jgi:hypothetical protein